MIARLPDTWIMLEELFGAILCFYAFVFLMFCTACTAVVYKKAATLFCCEKTEMFCGLQNMTEFSLLGESFLSIKALDQLQNVEIVFIIATNAVNPRGTDS